MCEEYKNADGVYWGHRFEEAEEAFQVLKELTKSHPANQWDKEYRLLAEAIHVLGRKVFYKD